MPSPCGIGICACLVRRAGSASRGSVIILQLYCHSVFFSDCNMCFLLLSLFLLYGFACMIGSRGMGSHGYRSKELSINGLENDGMYSYSTLDMLKMMTVRNPLMLHEQTLVARVVMVLCFRDTYVCSVGFSNFLNRSPCSSWEQHCSFETASAPLSLVVFVVSQMQGNGRGSSVSRQILMSADSSEGPVHAHVSDKFIVGTRYLRVLGASSLSRGCVLILKFF